MRNSAGLSTWHISTPAVAPSETENYDAAILISCDFGLVGLAVAGYALAADFGNEHQITELLTAVMPSDE